MQKLWGGILLLFWPLIALGVRTTMSFPLRMQSNNDFTKDRFGTPLTRALNANQYGSPPRVGTRMQITLSLTNLSDSRQTGTFELKRPIDGYGISNVIDDDPETPGQQYYDLFVMLCGTTTTFVGPLTGRAITRIPDPAVFQLGPNETKTYFIRMMAISRGHDTGAFRFDPLFKVSVNEDRGAVMGSYTYNTEPVAQSRTQICGVTFDATYAGYSRGLEPSNPIPLNGGRAF